NTQSLVGIRRWLDRVWRLADKVEDGVRDADTARRAVEQAVDKVSSDIDSFKFNTAVSCLMITSNTLGQERSLSRTLFHRYLQLLAPFAPQLAQEPFAATEGAGLIDTVPWPEPDSSLVTVDEVRIPVQVDGKVRGVIRTQSGADESTVTRLAMSEPGVVKHLEGREVIRTVFVPGKILNVISRNS